MNPELVWLTWFSVIVFQNANSNDENENENVDDKLLTIDDDEKDLESKLAPSK